MPARRCTRVVRRVAGVAGLPRPAALTGGRTLARGVKRKRALHLALRSVDVVARRAGHLRRVTRAEPRLGARERAHCVARLHVEVHHPTGEHLPVSAHPIARLRELVEALALARRHGEAEGIYTGEKRRDQSRPYGRRHDCDGEVGRLEAVTRSRRPLRAKVCTTWLALLPLSTRVTLRLL